ncbi:diguanylate cyclase (GGDEF)-like protein/PAS domain S-box-containing protein [Rhodobium gokarnense]|uniref:diguanylate cyclase n=2 Tax=Rhodobium gokarnense TaxID=364296 RepID=A0ABT3HFY8_9HYPH|nr:diguanylate cyclase (GGDEF)-like protein/PAS domain S-box-containing protein [Rhodobium gokarnense]
MDIVVQVGSDHRLIYVSPSVTAVLGWTPEEMREHPERLAVKDEMFWLVDRGERILRGEISSSRKTFRTVAKDGTLKWLDGCAHVIKDAGAGKELNIVLTLRDVTCEKLEEQEVRQLAATDVLTGLANRRSFDEALEGSWRNALRSGSQLSLLLLDLDRFKGLNDRYGHQVGDDCLRTVSATLVKAGARRRRDLAARYGGEELAVILPDTGSADAIAVAEHVRKAIEDLGLPNEDNTSGKGLVTASIGVATVLARSGGTMCTPEGLLMAADNALYKAKSEGRNRVVSTMLLAPTRAATG